MMIEVVMWDWKAQPPLDEIEEAINKILGKSKRTKQGIFLYDVEDTGGDDYAWLISDIPLKKNIVQKEFQKWYDQQAEED